SGSGAQRGECREGSFVGSPPAAANNGAGVAASQNMSEGAFAARPKSPKSSPAMVGGGAETLSLPKLASNAAVMRFASAGSLELDWEPPAWTDTRGSFGA